MSIYEEKIRKETYTEKNPVKTVEIAIHKPTRETAPQTSNRKNWKKVNLCLKHIYSGILLE